MSHQAARVLLRTEPEHRRVSLPASKTQAATRSQILPPAALLTSRSTQVPLLILQMPALAFKEVQNNIAACHPSRTRKFLYDAIQASGEVCCNMRQNWRKIFFDQHQGAAIPRVKKPFTSGSTGVQPETEKSTNQLTPCVSEDPTSSEEHWCDMDESNQNPIWMDPMSRYTLSTTHPTLQLN
ncbi:hypothetical protein BASA82_000689 [Batrachochytrium salamandrivorans]|nr:hypothetical protein BASA82_000689 [Batrachochytrium salamandrivorans]